MNWFEIVGVSIYEYNLNDRKLSNFRKSEIYIDKVYNVKCERRKMFGILMDKNIDNDEKCNYLIFVNLIYGIK